MSRLLPRPQALNPHADNEIAVKKVMIQEEMTEARRVFREIKILQNMNHPNVLKIINIVSVRAPHPSSNAAKIQGRGPGDESRRCSSLTHDPSPSPHPRNHPSTHEIIKMIAEFDGAFLSPHTAKSGICTI